LIEQPSRVSPPWRTVWSASRTASRRFTPAYDARPSASLSCIGRHCGAFAICSSAASGREVTDLPNRARRQVMSIQHSLRMTKSRSPTGVRAGRRRSTLTPNRRHPYVYRSSPLSVPDFYPSTI